MTFLYGHRRALVPAPGLDLQAKKGGPLGLWDVVGCGFCLGSWAQGAPASHGSLAAGVSPEATSGRVPREQEELQAEGLEFWVEGCGLRGFWVLEGFRVRIDNEFSLVGLFTSKPKCSSKNTCWRSTRNMAPRLDSPPQRPQAFERRFREKLQTQNFTTHWRDHELVEKSFSHACPNSNPLPYP